MDRLTSIQIDIISRCKGNFVELKGEIEALRNQLNAAILRYNDELQDFSEYMDEVAEGIEGYAEEQSDEWAGDFEENYLDWSQSVRGVCENMEQIELVDIQIDLTGFQNVTEEPAYY